VLGKNLSNIAKTLMHRKNGIPLCFVVILVVDDYPDTALALCRLLRYEGYPSATASDGRAALAAIRSHPAQMPLLLVLDDLMPGTNGVGMLEEIRSDPMIEHTAVMFYTASIDVERRDRAATLGAVAWLCKDGGRSLSVSELIKTIGQSYEKLGGTKRRKESMPDDGKRK
jgi:CheY-like chemotaxis protein